MKCLEGNSENLRKAVSVLKDGGIIAHPADTCFGLAADLMNPKALKKLQDIKGRDRDKPMSIMLPSYMKPKLNEFVQCSEFADLICDKLFPGPVTLVLPKGPAIPDYFFPELDTVGIRIPYDQMTDRLLLGFHGPIITTSANLSDEPACGTCEEVLTSFEDKENQPDLILGGALQGSCLPSTVLKIDDNELQILRHGPLSKSYLEALLGVKIRDPKKR